MPEFDPTKLRVDPTRERWERTDNVISFTDLILRWPYRAIINIAYELHWHIYDGKIDEDSPPLALYLCDDVVTGQDGGNVFHLCPVHITTPFEPFLPNLFNLFVLRHVVERLEKEHLNYTGKRPLQDKEDSLLLATPDNLNEVALSILWAWRRAMNRKKKIKDGNDSLTSDFWVEVRTAVDGLLPLAPESLSSHFSATDMEAASSMLSLAESSGKTEGSLSPDGKKAKEEAEKLLKNFSVNTWDERVIALEALYDAGFPRFDNTDIGQWLWRDQVLAPATYKKYGYRLYKLLEKTKGKSWENCPPDYPPVHP
nr:hypothetical protein [uncultured Desulfovibrio sp.]